MRNTIKPYRYGRGFDIQPTRFQRAKSRKCNDLPWTGRNSEVRIIRRGYDDNGEESRPDGKKAVL